jgi:hypothetical protein
MKRPSQISVRFSFEADAGSGSGSGSGSADGCWLGGAVCRVAPRGERRAQ